MTKYDVKSSLDWAIKNDVDLSNSRTNQFPEESCCDNWDQEKLASWNWRHRKTRPPKQVENTRQKNKTSFNDGFNKNPFYHPTTITTSEQIIQQNQQDRTRRENQRTWHTPLVELIMVPYLVLLLILLIFSIFVFLNKLGDIIVLLGI